MSWAANTTLHTALACARYGAAGHELSCRANPARFAKFATRVLGVEAGANDVETANRGIDAMEDFFHSIGMPTRISEMGITPSDEDLHELAYKCTFMDTRTIGQFVVLDKEAIYEIYKKAVK